MELVYPCGVRIDILSRSECLVYRPGEPWRYATIQHIDYARTLPAQLVRSMVTP